METRIKVLPEHWAPALINGDWTGLEYNGGADELRCYLNAHPADAAPVSCESVGFRWQHDAAPVLACDCAEYVYLAATGND